MLGKSKSEGAYYTKLDRLSKGDDPMLENIGSGKFILANKQDETKEEASSTAGVPPTTDSNPVAVAS